MPKSYAPGVEIQGPPEPQAWWSYGQNNGGSPVVIKRKLGYVVTALNKLGHWERVYAEEARRPEIERHPKALENLRLRIDNLAAWADYSTQVLRNCVRFALARIEDGPDRQELIQQRERVARAEVSKWTEEEQRFAEQTIFAGRHYTTLCGQFDMTASEIREKLKELRDRLPIQPFIKVPGRTNRRFHDELRYYARVLDSYLLAKTAAAGSTSRSSEAMSQVVAMLSKTIAVHKSRSGREIEDAEQQAALGILDACREYMPGKDGKLAQLNTYAQWKILRATQVRKASHCRPGLTMVHGAVKATGQIDISTDDEGRADQFHPASESDEATKMDVAAAMASLSDEERDLVVRLIQSDDKLADVAAETGLTIAQIRNRLNKAKEKLAARLKSHVC